MCMKGKAEQNSSLTQTEKLLPPRCNRILIYTTCYNVIDGVTLTVRKIEQEILSSGGHVAILTTRSGNDANTHRHGTHPNRQVIFVDNSIPIPFQDTYEIGFSLSAKIKEEIKDFRPSIIHMTVPDCTALYLMEHARAEEIPLMGTHHSNLPEYLDHYPGLRWLQHILGQYFRHSYNYLQALYCTTPYMRTYLTDTYKLHRVTQLGIWGRGIDLDRFSPVHRCAEFRAARLGVTDPDTAVICFCGRLVIEKRPDIFARVIQRLHKENVSFRALVIGAGPRQDVVKRLPNTTCIGWLDADELAVAYASADVFLFPSAVETFGNVTLEAAASGLPLVVEEACSGHLVTHNYNGYGCAADDVEAFYQATLSLVTNASKRKEYALNSRRASCQYEQKMIVRQMLANYTKVYDDFYSKYEGRHCKRDDAYKNAESFCGGMHPRPSSLSMIEFVFCKTFTLIWFLLGIVGWWKDQLQCCCRNQNASNVTTDAAVEEEQLVRIEEYSDTTDMMNGQRGKSKHLGDSECALYAAKVFVQTILFVWRLESRVWMALAHFLSFVKEKLPVGRTRDANRMQMQEDPKIV
uniref:Glycosyltransferase subfamily 4-like N-terminal domain-containing protein n=1 Tax=Ditylum brightwellii TaxID=49249 RepID=A0A7S4S953_9STRA